MRGIGGLDWLASDFLRCERTGIDGRWRLISDLRRSRLRFNESISGAANVARDLRRCSPSGAFKWLSWSREASESAMSL